MRWCQLSYETVFIGLTYKLSVLNDYLYNKFCMRLFYRETDPCKRPTSKKHLKNNEI